MRSIDERMAAVRSRSRRLRRRRDNRAFILLVCLMALPFVDLAGKFVAGGMTALPASDYSLFGASSLFGSSAGGYVIVAVIAAIAAVAVTLFLLRRRHSPAADETSDPTGDHAESDQIAETKGAPDERHS